MPRKFPIKNMRNRISLEKVPVELLDSWVYSSPPWNIQLDPSSPLNIHSTSLHKRGRQTSRKQVPFMRYAWEKKNGQCMERTFLLLLRGMYEGMPKGRIRKRPPPSLSEAMYICFALFLPVSLRDSLNLSPSLSPRLSSGKRRALFPFHGKKVRHTQARQISDSIQTALENGTPLDNNSPFLWQIWLSWSPCGDVSQLPPCVLLQFVCVMMTQRVLLSLVALMLVGTVDGGEA